MRIKAIKSDKDNHTNIYTDSLLPQELHPVLNLTSWEFTKETHMVTDLYNQMTSSWTQNNSLQINKNSIWICLTTYKKCGKKMENTRETIVNTNM